MSQTILTSESVNILRLNIIEADPDECWLFLAIKYSYFHKAGYGIIRPYRSRIDGKDIRVLAHRIAYMNHHNIYKLEDNIKVCYSCDNPPCCNPNHLFLGTDQTNSDDKVSKIRHSYGEDRPSCKLTEAKVLMIREEAAKGVSWTELSKRFGTNISNIGHIVNRRSWKHI